MTIKHYATFILGLFVATFFSVQIGNGLGFLNQLQLIILPKSAENFADFNFLYSQLPRAIMAICVGSMLGLVGSLMQQLTQNTLTSPLTLGTSSGAFLALIILNVWFPHFVANYSTLAAMTGALFAFSLIIIIAGIRNMTGFPFVVSGMVVNILLGSIAAAIILLNEQYAKNVFIWGAGDLAQNGWSGVKWLLPRISVALLILLFAPRVLTILRLGQSAAKARGLVVIPAFFTLMLLGIWLVSASITKVGVISFIGLITPNIARALGARTAQQELLSSMLLGALLLVLTDTLAILFSFLTNQVIQSGVTAALIGAPALIWFGRRKFKAQDSLTINLPFGRSYLTKTSLLLLCFAFLLALSLYFFIQLNETSFRFYMPSWFQLQLRLPRAFAALFTGVGLALAGAILQRLIRNPLASPDILGVFSGATFALVFTGIFLGGSFLINSWFTAFVGSLTVLLVLLMLGKKHYYAPSSLILTGIALTALIEAFIQFCLAKGTQDSYNILLYLSGSTYRVQPSQVFILGVAVSCLFIFTMLNSRLLNLISIGQEFSLARGLAYKRASMVLLLIVALLCALVTATVGPIAFVGLVAPHMAVMLGAKQAKKQLALASLIGATLMLWADFIGQVALYPMQIAAGTLVSILGGVYFLLLMIINRFK